MPHARVVPNVVHADARKLVGRRAFVAPDDHAGLRRALQALIADDRARGALAARAGDRAAVFAPRAMAAGYLAAYTDAVAAKAHRAEEGTTCA